MKLLAFWFLSLLSLNLLFTQNSVANDNFKVTTYNLGLAHTFVPLAKERIPHLINKIQQSDSDIICMQEVWTKEDRKLLVSKLKKKYPFVHKTKIAQKHSKNRPTCKVSDVFGKGKFFNCMTQDCKGTSGDDFTKCIVDKCQGILRTLKDKNPQCAQGVMAQVGKPIYSALYALFNPFKGAGLFSYKGSDGLVVVSKVKLENSRMIEMEDISTTSRRRVLVSDVHFKNKKHMVACTHLTANLSRSVPYTGEFESWEDENFEQAKRLINQTENIDGPVILAGDFNCSLTDSDRGVKSEFEKSCELFSKHGFFDLYSKENGECTYCEKNTLVKESKDENLNFVLDHIFTKGIDPLKSESKFLDLVTVKKDGEELETNLSDHYGVELKF